jgi:hypothetical protein
MPVASEEPSERGHPYHKAVRTEQFFILLFVLLFSDLDE